MISHTHKLISHAVDRDSNWSECGTQGVIWYGLLWLYFWGALMSYICKKHKSLTHKHLMRILLPLPLTVPCVSTIGLTGIQVVPPVTHNQRVHSSKSTICMRGQSCILEEVMRFWWLAEGNQQLADLMQLAAGSNKLKEQQAQTFKTCGEDVSFQGNPSYDQVNN